MDSSSGRVSFVMLGGALSPTPNDDQQHSIFGDNDRQQRRSIIEDDDGMYVCMYVQCIYLCTCMYLHCMYVCMCI